MATDSPSQSGKRHFHRGRRGQDRRGTERRTPAQQQARQAGDQPARGDHVDVEQIMREIRSGIAQRHGVDLTDQQVQELAARRLESILDPRTIKPSLLDQLRRAAGARPDTQPSRAEPPYTFEDTTLFESPNAFVRFMRKLLAPVLKLFFNPHPLIRALNVQARLNAESAKREAERDERQAEWNALHYDLLQRVVSETAKVSLEVQSLALRVESLAAKVDFNERRVRGIEGTMHQGRPAGPREREREREAPSQPDVPRAPQPPPSAQIAPEPAVAQPDSVTTEIGQTDAPKRRRRRRRGRRTAAPGEAGPAGRADVTVPGVLDMDEGEEEGDTEPPESDSVGAVAGSSGSDEFADPNEVRSAPDAAAHGFTPDTTADAVTTATPAAEAPLGQAVTTEGESLAEARPSERTEMASTPEPVRGPGLTLSRDRADSAGVLEPEATPDDPTPERGPTGQ